MATVDEDTYLVGLPSSSNTATNRRTRRKPRGEVVSVLVDPLFGSNRRKPTFEEEIKRHDEVIMKEALEQRLEILKLNQYLAAPEGQNMGSNVMDKIIVVIHFNSYCKAGRSPNQFIPSEFGLAAFSITKGLIASTSGLIDSGQEVPFGMRSDTKESAESTGIPMPGRHASSGAATMSPQEVVNVIASWSKKYGVTIEDTVWLFAERDTIPVTQRCLNWLLSTVDPAAELGAYYRLVPLSILMVEMSRVVYETNMSADGRQNPIGEGAAENIIRHPLFRYCPELGCEWHKQKAQADFVQFCSKNIVQRWTYNMMSYFCIICGVEKLKPSHEPILDNEDIVDRPLMKYLDRNDEEIIDPVPIPEKQSGSKS